jgi:acyl carrier protein
MDINRESVITWAKTYLASELSREISGSDLERSFTDIGLDSLDEMVMVGQMEEHFGIEFDPVTLLQYPIVIEMLEAAMTLAVSKNQ